MQIFKYYSLQTCCCRASHRKSEGQAKAKKGKSKIKRMRSERGGAEPRTCTLVLTTLLHINNTPK